MLLAAMGCGVESADDRYVAALLRHYESSWGPAAEVVHWTRGPVHELPQRFRVAVFPPRPGRSRWVYATVGMAALDDDEALELHLVSPRQADELVELLTAVAHYHRTGRRLGLHHTVNFGRPWLAGATCDFGLVSLPYLDGPNLEWLDDSGFRVRNLWLVPISEAERDFKIPDLLTYPS